MRNLVLAAQNEIVRSTPGENITLGTIDVSVCHVEILCADNGRCSLLHADRLTSAYFYTKDEVAWLKNGDENVKIKRISVRTKQTDWLNNESMQERIKEFEEKLRKDITFNDEQIIEVAPNKHILFKPRDHEVITCDDNEIIRLGTSHEERLLQAKKRMHEYIVGSLICDARPGWCPPAIYYSEGKSPVPEDDSSMELFLTEAHNLHQATKSVASKSAKILLIDDAIRQSGTRNIFMYGAAPNILEILQRIDDLEAQLAVCAANARSTNR